MVFTEKDKGIRDEMVNKYGMDNSKIGWDGKNVTYDGKYFMTPANVSGGTSYAPKTEINKAATKYFSNGDIGVRSALQDRGVDTSKLGYNNGIITYDGKDLMKPDRVQNGISYVNDPNAITAAAINAHKINGNNIVKAKDYLANKQLPFDDISYENEMISFAGQNIKPLFVDGGFAYVDASEMDKAVANAQKSMGTQDRNTILDKYREGLNPYVKKYEDTIENREPFSYDYASDPVYKSLKDMYTREGDRVMRDVMGEYAANTGGYVNSAGITAGAQANNYYMQQLGDKIPQLFEAAYGRHNTDHLNELKGLEGIIGLKEGLFNTEYGVNSDILNDIYKNYSLKQQNEINEYNKRMDERAMRIEDEALTRDKEVAELQKILQSGQFTGSFTDEQNRWLANYYGEPEGTVFDPFGIEKNAAALEYELATKYSTPKATSYKSGGGGGVSKTKIKNSVGYLNDLFKNNDYVNRLIGESSPIRYNDGEISWNTQIPEGSKHSFKHPILNAVLNDETLNDTERNKILYALGFTDYDLLDEDSEYRYITKQFMEG